MKFILFAVWIILFHDQIIAQNKFDSLVFSRKTEQIEGLVPTYYTTGYRLKAEIFKNTFEKAIHFYEALYPVHFVIKLAILDSAQWLKEICPYGYLNYDSGWAMIPAKMSYGSLLQMYGIENKRKNLDSLLIQNNLTPDDLVSSIFLVFSLHELGHYFIMDLNHAITPDMFANELIATHFSLNYFKSTDGKDLANLILFSKFISQNYRPKFHKIEDMDSLYTNMTIQNFKWYHCNLVLLCNDIYREEAGSFIQYYLNLFSKKSNHSLTTSEIISLLDKGANNTVGKWAQELDLNISGTPY
jgi:hypothetical protein